MRPSRPDISLVRGRSVRADRVAIGTNLHMRDPFQRETAQRCHAGDVGLLRLVKTCQRSIATRCPCVATHLFQSLDLEGQVRAPIRGLPAFLQRRNTLRSCAKHRQELRFFRQSVAGSSAGATPILPQAYVHSMALHNTQQSRKGTWQCRQNSSCWPSPCVAGFRPVEIQLESRSSMAPAQGRLAPFSWMATLSPVQRSAPQRTSFIARKTPESADRTPAFFALTSRPAMAGSSTTQMPCPDVFRGRHLAFRPSAQAGPTRAQGTANV